MKYFCIFLVIILIISANCLQSDNWSVRIEVSDDFQSCIVRTQPRIKNQSIVWDAYFSCDKMSYGQVGTAEGFVSEKTAIKEAIRNFNSRCIRSSGCISYGNMFEIDEKLKNIN
ncbi:hypothetical protein BpHYR1_039755 [Brachionus plicatilis]|uniref:Uncharacterized protein n=1 Tax=Brachionus plicatilis TaxID=10195 RepID=A0A3M7SKR1_BRAPC|nr:hypothetical protein BpHYR1_039755 [Brachionus plicatilis]